MPEYGPFNSEREALDTQAYAALRAIDDTDPDLRAFPAACLKLITDACEAAGAELGAYDLAWLRWLTGWEITHCLPLAGIIRRAFEAGQRAAQPPEGTVTGWAVEFRAPDGRAFLAEYPDEATARERAHDAPLAVPDGMTATAKCRQVTPRVTGMKKIPTLFERDWDGDRRYVLPAVVAGCEWVTEGDGVPTRKYDGTCVMFDGDRWWARREVKEGKTAPDGFVALETDAETGKTVGWEAVEQSSFYTYWHDARSRWAYPQPGTYELIGPKVNGNPDGAQMHILVMHDRAENLDELHADDVPRDFDGLAAWLHAHPYEGIVWHHPDGRMAKIKRRDFPKPEGDGHG